MVSKLYFTFTVSGSDGDDTDAWYLRGDTLGEVHPKITKVLCAHGVAKFNLLSDFENKATAVDPGSGMCGLDFEIPIEFDGSCEAHGNKLKDALEKIMKKNRPNNEILCELINWDDKDKYIELSLDIGFYDE